jgi:hypothetical protein
MSDTHIPSWLIDCCAKLERQWKCTKALGFAEFISSGAGASVAFVRTQSDDVVQRCAVVLKKSNWYHLTWSRCQTTTCSAPAFRPFFSGFLTTDQLAACNTTPDFMYAYSSVVDGVEAFAGDGQPSAYFSLTEVRGFRRPPNVLKLSPDAIYCVDRFTMNFMTNVETAMRRVLGCPEPISKWYGVTQKCGTGYDITPTKGVMNDFGTTELLYLAHDLPETVFNMNTLDTLVNIFRSTVRSAVEYGLISTSEPETPRVVICITPPVN